LSKLAIGQIEQPPGQKEEQENDPQMTQMSQIESLAL